MMKNQILFSILIFASLNLHAQFKSYQTLPSDIPPPFMPSTSIELFFENEQGPRGDVLQLGTIEVHIPNTSNIQRLANKMHEMAKTLGVDGVLDITSEVNMTFDGTPVGILKGEAFMYLKNITYLDRLIKKEEFEIAENSVFKTALEIYTKPNGTVDSTFSHIDNAYKIYEANAVPHDLRHILDEKKNWKFKLDVLKRTRTRMLYRYGNWKTKRVDIFYGRNSNVIKDLKITYFKEKGNTITEMVKFHTDSEKVEGISILENNKTKKREKFTYDDKGRLIQRDIFFVDNTGYEAHLYRCKYTYYSQEDLPLFLMKIEE
jgi:hypothetical protein